MSHIYPQVQNGELKTAMNMHAQNPKEQRGKGVWRPLLELKQARGAAALCALAEAH